MCVSTRLVTMFAGLIVAAAVSAQTTFENAAARLGLSGAPAGRPQLIDVNEDGWLDLVVQGTNPDAAGSLRVFLNAPNESGERSFQEKAAKTGLLKRPNGKPGRQHSFVVWGDLNGDTCLDAISIARQGLIEFGKDPQNHAIYLGNGKGSYRYARGGIERNEHQTTHGAVLCDLDLDGVLDVVFGNSYDDESAGLRAQQMRVYRGQGKGRFAEMTGRWGSLTSTAPGAANAARPLYGLSAADLDNDGYPEIIGAAYGRQWNTLWKRTPENHTYGDFAAAFGVDGDGIRHGKYSEATKRMFRERFGQERADELPYRANGNNFALVPCDFDGDGDNDLFNAALTHAWAGESSDLSALLVNQFVSTGVPFFQRALEPLDEPDPQTGLRWMPGLGLTRDHSPQRADNWNQGDLQAHWADLDNDGLVDLIVCESDYPHNRLRVWRQLPDHQFEPTELAWGLRFPNCPGAAIGDFDRDGDLDIAANGTRTRWPEARAEPELALWLNRSPRANGFLVVRLVGNGRNSNTSAIGARLFLTTTAGTQTREILGPYGHWGAQMQPGEVHFGLGTAKPLTLKVIWPNKARKTVVFENPRPNAWIVVYEDREDAVTMELFDASAWRR